MLPSRGERGRRILYGSREAEALFVKQNFAAIIRGGTGQVGGAAVAELLATFECREVVRARGGNGPASVGAESPNHSSKDAPTGSHRQH
jgi:hypothetical protein